MSRLGIRHRKPYLPRTLPDRPTSSSTRCTGGTILQKAVDAPTEAAPTADRPSPRIPDSLGQSHADWATSRKSSPGNHTPPPPRPASSVCQSIFLSCRSVRYHTNWPSGEGREKNVGFRGVAVCRYGGGHPAPRHMAYPRYWVDGLPQSVRHGKSSMLKGGAGIRGAWGMGNMVRGGGCSTVTTCMGWFCLRRPDAEAIASWGWLQSGAAVRELGGRCSSVPSEMMGLWSRCVCLSSHPSAVMLRCPGSDCLGCHCLLPTGLAGEMKDRFYFRHEMHQSSLAGSGWSWLAGLNTWAFPSPFHPSSRSLSFLPSSSATPRRPLEDLI